MGRESNPRVISHEEGSRSCEGVNDEKTSNSDKPERQKEDPRVLQLPGSGQHERCEDESKRRRQGDDKEMENRDRPSRIKENAGQEKSHQKKRQQRRDAEPKPTDACHRTSPSRPLRSVAITARRGAPNPFGLR